jgi:hypothetical protein
MINTSTAAFVLVSGSNKQFNGSSIICEPLYIETSQTFHVTLRVLESASTNEIERTTIYLTKAEVDAETGTGSGETDPWFNAVQKASITKLSAYSGNGSTTFTIV